MSAPFCLLFYINSSGSFYAANSKFQVDKDANLVSEGTAQFGNVKINNGVFYKDTALRDGSLYLSGEGGDSQLSNTSLMVGSKIYINADGINANDSKITNVANGENPNDAVNKSKLDAVSTVAGQHITLTEKDGNIVVTKTEKDGQLNYDVSLNKDIDIDTANIANGLTVGGTTGITISGKDKTITGLSNTKWVATQTVANRAATEGQLSDVDTKVNNVAVDTPHA